MSLSDGSGDERAQQLDLEQCRKRAKELLRACRRGERDALERVRAHAPRWRDPGDRDFSERVRLADAQLALARELGFASWPALVESVEVARATFAERVERFLTAATSRRLDRARALLERDPAIEDADVHAALVLGRVERVEKALRRDPRLASRAAGLRSWEPLLYVCHSAFLGRDPVRTPGLVATARLLLAHGADPNASFPHSFGPQSALYGAAGVAHEPELTRLLLESGANPNDGESLYHATEARDGECVRLLLQHGARPHGNDVAHALDYRDDAEIVRMLLEHGADASATAEHHGELWRGATALHHAVLRGRSPEILGLLVEHGADLEARDGAGRSPYALAVALGRDDLAHALAELGAKPVHDPVDTFVGACIRGDAPVARALLGRHPELPRSLRESDRQALIEAVRRGRVDAVRLMLELGFGTDVRGELGGTPLHFAAWHGRPELVELLLAHGASPEAIADTGPAANALTWAAHGSANAPDAAEGDYVRVAERLLASGSRVETWMIDDASEELAEWLEARPSATA